MRGRVRPRQGLGGAVDPRAGARLGVYAREPAMGADREILYVTC